jgi:dTDP-4-amino-4,6-dideoxygalactose transaminase
LRGAGAPPEAFLLLLGQTESRLDTEPIVPRKPSWVSKLLMAHTDFSSVAKRRRRNWELLRRSLRGSLATDLTVLHDVLESGEAPLGLAVRVAGGQREVLRRFLADHGIFCPVHWPLSHVPTSTELALDHELSSQILTLPIDQRMEESHVRRFVKLLQQFFADAPKQIDR